MLAAILYRNNLQFIVFLYKNELIVQITCKTVDNLV